MLKDKYGRNIDYLRIAVTDRCNLRCTYCMPDEGIQYMERKELLSLEEVLYLIDILTESGIKKVRITGGEPFVRKDLMDLLERITGKHPELGLFITTNGSLIGPYIKKLETLNLKGINFSLDTLNKKKFALLTRRDEFESVFGNFRQLLETNIPVKVNCVVMPQHNLEDIESMIMLTKNLAIDVRFIEEMPFNGENNPARVYWNAAQLEKYITSLFPHIQPLINEPGSSARLFKLPGFSGNIGIIEAYTRTFCSSCNRLRLNARGELITCLYGKGEGNIRDLIRAGKSKEFIKAEIERIVASKYKDGFEAEAENRSSALFFESMSTIGG